MNPCRLSSTTQALPLPIALRHGYLPNTTGNARHNGSHMRTHSSLHRVPVWVQKVAPNLVVVFGPIKRRASYDNQQCRYHGWRDGIWVRKTTPTLETPWRHLALELARSNYEGASVSIRTGNPKPMYFTGFSNLTRDLRHPGSST